MDEHQLVKSCLKGKPAAQKELYDRFAEQMLGVCYRYTKSLTDAGPVGAWIRRIRVTTAQIFLKKHSRYRTELSFVNNDALTPVVVNDAEVKMTARELAELIRQLPTGYQTIFNLHAVEGFTHVEIGSMLGISDGTSRSQYARARSLLISWVEKKSMIKNDHYAG